MLVDVALPYRLSGFLTYELPVEMAAESGSRLLVPLGNRQVVGCLLGESKRPPPPRLKKITEVLDKIPLLNSSQIKLITWASQYYLTPIGEVLRHFLPPSLLKKKNSRKTKKIFPVYLDFHPKESFALNKEQESVLKKIEEGSSPFLLQGITGSGKTEIYIHLARKTLAQQGQVLVLVPEIALTPQLIGRFEQALSIPVVPYHSGLTESQRLEVWLGAQTGEIPLVIGTRSAVFLPFPKLKLVVVDEEHDSSYKQEERFCYNGRDLALWRGNEEKATVLLGSATPSLESLYRCQTGKMTRLQLTARPGNAVLPEVELVDRRALENRNHYFSERLKNEMTATLKRKEQILLFLNRRGFSPFLICPHCGLIPECDQCEISLTFHKGKRSLVCHYCNASTVVPEKCPRCKTLPLKPEGVGTERIEEELKATFPNARVARLDRDTSSEKQLMSTLSRMKKGEIDILVGTQTVGKGHDYPNLTLVGVVDGDTAMHLPDFRAAERTVQLLTQVAGRSGRAEKPGRVIIQTYQPDHPGLKAAAEQNLDSFVTTELEQRKEAGYPPFCRLIRILLYGQQPEKVRQAAEDLTYDLSRLESQVLGPSPCPLQKIRGKTRWHLLIKSRQFAKLQPHLQRRLDEFSSNRLPSGVRMVVNVDPMEMM